MDQRTAAWLGRGTPAVGVVGFVPRAVAPQRVQDASELARDRNRCDVFAPSPFDLRSPLGDGIGRTVPSQNPRGLHQSTPHRSGPGFGDAGSVLSPGAGMFPWRQPEIRLDRVGTRKPRDVVDGRGEPDTADGTDAWNGHEPFAEWVFVNQLLEFLVGESYLLVEGVDDSQHVLDEARDPFLSLERGIANTLGECACIARPKLEHRRTSPAANRVDQSGTAGNELLAQRAPEATLPRQLGRNVNRG